MVIDQSIMIYIIAGLAFVSVVGIGFAFSGNGSSAAQQKRLKQVAAGPVTTGKRQGVDTAAARRKQMADSMKSLREREAKRRKDINTRSLQDRLNQANLQVTPSTFWILSAVVGLAAAATAFLAGLPYLVVAGIGFATGVGLPRWAVGFAIGLRQKKFSSQFADGIDIIVRGVKSGLPLIECLRIIARESPAPLNGEFARVIDNIQMGTTVEKALEKLYKRMPLPEVNFFAIVITIQQQAGGNLSEALGNLSAVLRSRKMLKEKIKALSAEAKASAMIIGSLPIIVMVLVYMTTPEYIMELFTSPKGHFILLIAGGLMSVGIFVMNKMMNFDH